MWSYINCNWEAQPMWKGVGFGDTRLSIDSSVMDKWYDEVTGSRRFIRATDYELCTTDYESYKHFDDDAFPFRNKIYRAKHARFHPYDDDDGYYRKHHALNEDNTDREGSSNGRWVWGHERAVGGNGIWEAVLPLVMLASSLAIVGFLFLTTKRRINRLGRTPRRQRVRFAYLDSMEEDDDGSAAMYGSICSPDDSESSRWRRSVRRITPNLIVANTADGTTVVA